MNKFIAVCTNCGRMIGKYGPGSDHETICPQCKAQLEITTHNNELTVRVLNLKQGNKTITQT